MEELWVPSLMQLWQQCVHYYISCEDGKYSLQWRWYIFREDAMSMSKHCLNSFRRCWNPVRQHCLILHHTTIVGLLIFTTFSDFKGNKSTLNHLIPILEGIKASLCWTHLGNSVHFNPFAVSVLTYCCYDIQAPTSVMVKAHASQPRI